MKTILLVEDNEGAIWVYSDQLKNHYNLLIARDYTEFEVLLPKAPDLVLTDFNFPGGDGNDVAKASRAAGVNHIALQTSALTGKEDSSLYDVIFEKSELKGIIKYLKEKLV